VVAVTGLFAAGLILLALAALADLVGGQGMRSGPLYLLGAAGSACLAALGGFALAGRSVQLGVGGWLGQAVPGQPTAALAADRLSGMFLALSFGAAVPVSLAFAAWSGGDHPPQTPPHGAATRPPVPPRRGLGASYALALGAVAVIMTARDAFTALFGWESLTVAFYLLAGSERHKRGRAGAAQVTFAFGKLSGAALLIGLLLLATRSHSIMLASFAHVPGGAARTTAQVLLLAGFAIKAGLVPFQIWLPRGYAAAPGPARAIMAGVCVNVAFYGMWRTLALLGRAPGAVVGVVLVLGAVTALLGIAHAAVQNRLSRVIAYSSIENTGLIVTGFGIALTGAAVDDRRLIAAGLLAATLQIVAHTVAKSLLFTSAAGLEAAVGSDDLEALRSRNPPGSDLPGNDPPGNDPPGRAPRTPWSGFGLAIGSLTLAGLPPTAGFVSEWFLLESLMQQFRVPGLGYRLVLALAGAAVALTAGFAGVTFVRIVGLIVLNRGTSEPPLPAATSPAQPGATDVVSVTSEANATHEVSAPPPIALPDSSGTPDEPPRWTIGVVATTPMVHRDSASAPRPPAVGGQGPVRGDYGWGGRVAVVVLAACCLGIAAVTPLEIRVIAAGLSPDVPSALTMGALKSPWVLQPVFAGFSILSPSWLCLELPVMLLLVGLFAWAASGRRLLRVRRVPAWRSATIGVDGADSYTAFGYANPTRRVLAGVLHTRTEIRQIMLDEDDRDDGSGAPDVADGDLPELAAHLSYASDVVEVVETFLYRPQLRFFMKVVAIAKRLQSGRLDAYLLYMLIALIAVIAVVVALA
jgi:formate hydrogenlyase subunit 3/multisubunit Na+/H+ antiporter MnhD subunit